MKKKLFTTLVLLVSMLMGAGVVVAAPASAAECGGVTSTPCPPEVPACGIVTCPAALQKCETDRDALRVSAAGWKAQSEALEELYASSQASRERLSAVVNQWQLRVVDQAATIERQRHRIERLADRRDHLSSKVRALRAKIRALR